MLGLPTVNPVFWIFYFLETWRSKEASKVLEAGGKWAQSHTHKDFAHILTLLNGFVPYSCEWAVLSGVLWAAVARHDPACKMILECSGKARALSGLLAEALRTWWRCSTVFLVAKGKSNSLHFTIPLHSHSVSGDPNWFLILPESA